MSRSRAPVVFATARASSLNIALLRFPSLQGSGVPSSIQVLVGDSVQLDWYGSSALVFVAFLIRGPFGFDAHRHHSYPTSTSR